MIGERIRKTRKSSGMTIEKIASRMNKALVTYLVIISAASLFAYERLNSFKDEISTKFNQSYSTIDSIIKERMDEDEKTVEIKVEEPKLKMWKRKGLLEKYGMSNDLILYVNKEENYLDLADTETGELLYRFKTTDGRNKGNKERGGDARTPEGNYRIVDACKSDSTIFGDYKILIDYPHEKKIGWDYRKEDVYICGADTEYKKNGILNGIDVTNGNIVLMNDDIKKIYEQVTKKRTLIVIR